MMRVTGNVTLIVYIIIQYENNCHTAEYRLEGC